MLIIYFDENVKTFRSNLIIKNNNSKRRQKCLSKMAEKFSFKSRLNRSKAISKKHPRFLIPVTMAIYSIFPLKYVLNSDLIIKSGILHQIMCLYFFYPHN